MANKEQVERLKKGVEGWNKWREENPETKIDLEAADFVEAQLEGVDLSIAHLTGADFSGANLCDANLTGADLKSIKCWGANLREAVLLKANLSKANFSDAILANATLIEADLRQVNLRRANLRGADLRGTEIRQADLGRADLTRAALIRATLNSIDLNGANLSGAVLGLTVIGNIDLSEVRGLDKVIHDDPSTIGADTIKLSKGKIPETFLRGCGLGDWEIESAKLYQPGLSSKEVNDIVYCIYDLRATQAIQINPLFISYSHKDSTFVDAIEKHLDMVGIRFWRDIHHATAGRLEKVVDRAMRQNPTVLLVLSENSVKSDWVEHEARSARELEKELKRDVLCPVALDGAWKDCNWPARLREQIMEYNILDFSNWKDDAEFTRKFAMLVEGLDLFYKEK